MPDILADEADSVRPDETPERAQIEPEPIEPPREAASSCDAPEDPGPIFEDAELRSLKSRALAYLRLGIPVHFRGRAGMGKTTLARAIAAELARPVTLVTGDQCLTSADLLGRPAGQETRRVHDRYVQRVTRSETKTRTLWAEGPLARAMAGGHVLIYDEFTRSPPAANNALLSALEEREVVLSNPLAETRVVAAHPEFRAIFTSNPDDYAGVSAAPDALFDRMISFDLSWVGPATEAGILAWRAGLATEDAETVVGLLRALRETIPGDNPPSLRTAILIGRVMRAFGLSASARDERFVQVCLDALETRAPRNQAPEERAAYLANLRRQILSACRASAGRAA